MPRNGLGTYFLPQSPFVAGTVISSAAMNSDLSDIATALTGSLARDGQTGMSGQLKLPDGALANPGLSFNNETNTGLTRPSAGQIGVVINGAQVATFSATGINGTLTGEGSVPIGTIVDYVSSPPAGWLFCFGQAVSRTTFAALFAVISIQYGSGDGSTTFNVPDCRGNILVGRDDMGGSAAGRLTTPFYGGVPTIMGAVGGGQSRTLITANLPAYTPAGSVSVNSTATNVVTGTVTGSNQGTGVTQGVLVSGTGASGTLTSTGSLAGTAQGGSSTAFASIQPSLIVNKIIYAGN